MLAGLAFSPALLQGTIVFLVPVTFFVLARSACCRVVTMGQKLLRVCHLLILIFFFFFSFFFFFFSRFVWPGARHSRFPRRSFSSFTPHRVPVIFCICLCTDGWEREREAEKQRGRYRENEKEGENGTFRFHAERREGLLHFFVPKYHVGSSHREGRVLPLTQTLSVCVG